MIRFKHRIACEVLGVWRKAGEYLPVETQRHQVEQLLPPYGRVLIEEDDSAGAVPVADPDADGGSEPAADPDPADVSDKGGADAELDGGKRPKRPAAQ